MQKTLVPDMYSSALCKYVRFRLCISALAGECLSPSVEAVFKRAALAQNLAHRMLL